MYGYNYLLITAIVSPIPRPENCSCRRLALLALRPDLPPDPERLPGNLASQEDGGSGPGWPLPASGPTGAARGLWQKMSFSHRNFAASRLRVNP
ncbi:MAG: hypothetical protein NTX42_05385 [Methanothrix sp.]|nr:hypothetical protein [Methanothrix sp.]